VPTEESLAAPLFPQLINNSKGYGFIGRADGPHVFVHYSAIAGDGYRTLQEGDSVEFEIVQGPKGPEANNLIKIEESINGALSRTIR
jgi:CspA family cold shock protein